MKQESINESQKWRVLSTNRGFIPYLLSFFLMFLMYKFLIRTDHFNEFVLNFFSDIEYLLLTFILHYFIHCFSFPSPKKAIMRTSIQSISSFPFVVKYPEKISKKRFQYITIMPLIVLTFVPFIILLFKPVFILAYIALFNVMFSAPSIWAFAVSLSWPKDSVYKINGSEVLARVAYN